MIKKTTLLLVAALLGAATASAGSGPDEPRWIGCDNPGDVLHGSTVVPGRCLRKEFGLSRRVRSAELSICGLGLYELWINGKHVSRDQVLSPTVADYTKHVYYNTFDVAPVLRKGVNAVGVALGNGRFVTMRTVRGITPATTHYGLPMLWFRLDVTYADGSRERICSDDSWKITADGPVRANNEFDGEVYDARLEFDGWTKPRFDDSAWKPVLVREAPAGRLEPQPNPNIAIQDRLVPVSVTRKGDAYILDMGQNMVGWLQVTAKGLSKGDTLSLRFAETLKADGTLYMDNLREAKVTDSYVARDGRRFTWHPSFVYHGFRFVEVKGLKRAPKASDFEGQVLYDKMALTGRFETSHPVINQVYRNAYWGIRGNYRGMPTDCPQRDERMGWFGDRATGCYGESYLFDNHALYAKWLQDIEDSQNPDGHLPDVAPRFWNMDSDNMTWPSVFITAADMVWQRFGDTAPVVKHYAAMKKWLGYMRGKYLKDGIMTKDTYGDWCMPPESLELIHAQDPALKTPGPVISTAFYWYLLNKMSAFAPVAGHPEDAATFRAQAAETKAAFNRDFFHPDQGCYANNTVTANLLGLYLGLVPEGREQDVFKHIVDKTEIDCGGHVSTGVIGIMFLMRALTEYGRPDLALKIATNVTYPSWGYMAANGATTIWELWNGNTAAPSMNSGNHVMLLGDLLIWEYEYLGGIRPLEPGYRTIGLKPYPVEGLDWVNCSYDSVHGKIVSNWKLQDGVFDWEVEVPSGTTAKAWIPAKDGTRTEQTLAPGKHRFTVHLR